MKDLNATQNSSPAPSSKSWLTKGTLEENRAKDFMIIPTNKNFIYRMRSWLVILLWSMAACSTGPVDDPIPVVPFPDLTINLSFPEYQSIAVDGGTKGINA